MPPRTTTKGKVAGPKQAAGGPKRRPAKKPPQTLTPTEMRKFLNLVEHWWAKLDGDVKAVEALIQELPPRQPLSAEVKRKFRELRKKLKSESRCAFAQPHMLHL